MSETHSAMVHRLVKWHDTAEGDILHACVGICGEVIEFRNCQFADHEREELGDIVFYIKHLREAFARWGFLLTKVPHLAVTRAIGDELLLKSAGELLDLAKKCWVYKTDPMTLMGKFSTSLTYLEDAFEYTLRSRGYELSEVEQANQFKLSTGPNARYPLGYSDAAANARADKPAGE